MISGGEEGWSTVLDGPAVMSNPGGGPKPGGNDMVEIVELGWFVETSWKRNCGLFLREVWVDMVVASNDGCTFDPSRTVGTRSCGEERDS